MNTFVRENHWYVLLCIISVMIIVGVLWQLLRPVSLPEPATPVQISEARELGLEWIIKNFDGEIFRYEFDPMASETPQGSNALRQLMASRVVSSEANKGDRFNQIHLDNMEYVFSEWYKEDFSSGYVLFKDKSKLGASAMLLRTIVASPHYEKYQNEARMLSHGIIALQNVDGSFEPWYVEPDYEFDADYLLYFYSGEAILALVEYYEKSGDRDALLAAEKASDFYIGEYVDRINENYHPAYVPWHTMSYYRLYKLTDENRYLESIYVMNDRLLELLDMSILPGRFYKKELAAEGQVAPHTSSDAVYLEGMLYAYELAMESGEVERAGRYKEAIDLSATRLVNIQHLSGKEGFLAESITYIGAIPVRENNSRIRVDTVQHTLDAFEKYLALFGSE